MRPTSRRRIASRRSLQGEIGRELGARDDLGDSDGGLNVAPGADREPLVQRTIISSLRYLAELTAGSAAFYEDAARAFDRVAKTTQAAYRLGYQGRAARRMSPM